MTVETKKVFDFLCGAFNGLSRFRTVYKSFKDCSRDSANNRYVVNSKVKAINFDKVTRKLYSKNYPRSADALAFSGNDVFLIEFKAGDQVVGIYNTQHLTSALIDKINGSEQTLYSKVFSIINNLDVNILKLRFYVVVDVEAMGITALVRTQAELASGEVTEQDEKLRVLLARVLPDMKAGTQNPDHYEEIGIWYSDVFDQYLESYDIKNIGVYERL